MLSIFEPTFPSSWNSLSNLYILYPLNHKSKEKIGIFTNSDITQRLPDILDYVKKNNFLVNYPVYSLNLWFKGWKMYKFLTEVQLEENLCLYIENSRISSKRSRWIVMSIQGLERGDTYSRWRCHSTHSFPSYFPNVPIFSCCKNPFTCLGSLEDDNPLLSEIALESSCTPSCNLCAGFHA